MAAGWAVVLGVGVALAIITVVIVFFGAELHRHVKQHGDPAVDALAALLLFVLAGRSWWKRSKPSTKPSLAESLTNTSPKAYLVVGATAMLLDFTSIVLYLPAIREITKSSAGLGASAVALAVMILFIMLPVLAPVAVATVFGKRADRTLDRLHGFVVAHSTEIAVVVELGFAIYFVIKAVTAISS